MALLVKVNGERYRVPLSPSDITLRTHLLTVQAETEMPEELKSIVEETDKETRDKKARRMPKKVYAKKVIPYYAKIIRINTGIPEEAILGGKHAEGMPVHLIEKWYWQIIGAYANFQPSGQQLIDVNGELWTLPEKMMAKSTFGEFAEAAQYEDYAADVAAGNWEKMPYVMAVLLKPPGEKFNPDTFDDIVEERAEIMRGLTMDKVYEVSFFLLTQKQKSVTASLIYTAARQLATFKRASAS